jgi:hypothetical protein
MDTTSVLLTDAAMQNCQHTPSGAVLNDNRMLGRTIAIFDPSVADYHLLTDGLHPHITPYVLDPNQDGILQITQILKAHYPSFPVLEPVERPSHPPTLYLFTHGSPGTLRLGSTELSLATCDRYTAALRSWFPSAGWADAEPTLYLYACNVAAGDAGAEFLQKLHHLTGATIHATSHSIGNGTWHLPTSYPPIHPSPVRANGGSTLPTHPLIHPSTLTAYPHTLAAPIINDSATLARAIAEETALTITGLSISDPSSPTSTVTLTITNGTLALATTTGLSVTGNNSGTVTLSGAIADINTALNGVTFTPNANISGNVTLAITANDGVLSASRNVAIAVTPVNDAPAISPTAPSVAEGGSVAFTTANFGIADVDTLPVQIILKLDRLPEKGYLTLNGSRLVVGSTFPSDQVGQLRYHHDGTQTTAVSGTSDNFRVIVDDGAGGVIGPATIPITITPVNQLPTVGGTTQVFEGQADVPVTIAIADPDQTAATYNIVIRTLPADGTLKLNGVAITTGNRTITSADLPQLTYSHNGNDANFGNPPDDSFQIDVVDDGGGTGTPGTTPATINLRIRPNNDDPILARNNGLTLNTVGDGLFKLIRSTDLQVTDVDSGTTQLTYRITQAPDAATGTLQRLVNGNWQILSAGTSFTQNDLDNDRIRYVFHRSSTGGETFNDSFRFEVRDSEITEYPVKREGGIWQPDGSALAVNTFNIAITIPASTPGGSGSPSGTVIPVNASPDTIVKTGIAGLLEGGSTTITNAMLFTTDPDNTSSEIVYRVERAPTSGVIKLNGQALGLYGSFTQDDIDNNRVTFEHAGEEDFIDDFRFTVTDGVNTLAEQAFGIDVIPQNDTPSVTVNGSPNVVEGGTVTVTNAHVSLADVDGTGEKVGIGYATPNSLTFTVTTLPTYGKLQVNQGSGFVDVTLGAIITKAQLDSSNFRYVHDGSENFADSFSVQANDNTSGTSNNLSAIQTVNIEIARLNDDPGFTASKSLTVGEGGSGVIKGSNGVPGDEPHLVYEDPDNTTIQRQYRITTPVANGILFLNGSALSVGSVFTQDDLDNNRVSYLHNGSETSTDSFAFQVRDGGGGVVPGTYNIDITPRNDAPTVAAPAELVFATGAAQTFTGGNAIALTDVDLTNLVSGETDRIRVTLDPQLASATYANGTLNLVNTTGITFIDPATNLSFSSGSNNNTSGNRLIIEGSIANVQAALNSLTYQVSTDVDDVIRLVVTVDDRLRDGSGAVIGANGGSTNSNGLPLGDANNTAQTTILLYTSNSNDPSSFTNIPTARSVSEEGTLTFTGTDRIEIADVDAFPIAAAAGSVRLHAGYGNLTIGNLNGATISAGANNSLDLTLTGTRDQINAALLTLTYTGSNNYNNVTTPDSLVVTLLASTSGNGVGLGGATNLSQTIALTVNPVNDAPTLTAPTGTLTASSTDPVEFIGATAITVDDPDLNPPAGGLPGTDILRVKIDPTPGWTGTSNYGILTLGATAGITLISGTNGGTIAQSADGATGPLIIEGTRANVQAALTNLSYTPPVNADRTVNLAVTVLDRANGGPGELTASRTISINASSENDAPVLTAPANPLSVNEDATLTFTGAGNFFSFTDADDFGASNLTATITATRGTLSLVGADGATVGGSGTATLTLTGTKAQINAALDGLIFTPTANYHGTATVQVTVNDQGNVGTGGAKTDTKQVSITVNPVNDRPTATGSVSLGSVPEDTSNPTGTLISTLITGSNYSDAIDNQTANSGNNTATPLSYIAIVGDTNYVATQGSWQFSNGAGGWITIPDSGLSNTAAIIIPADRELRFLPAANFHGTPGTLTTRLADGSSVMTASTSPTDLKNLNTVGGLGATGAWSSGTIPIGISVTSINDAPTVNAPATPVTLTAVNEDTANPAGATVSSLFGPKYGDVTDNQSTGGANIPGGGNSATAFGGVAIVGNTSTAAQGEWQYRLSSGSWTVIPATVADTAALLLPTDASLRFVPATDYNGTPPDLVAQLADSPITFNAASDISAILGGTNTWSSGTALLRTSITAVNDAPVLSGTGVTVGYTEQLTAAPVGTALTGISDVEIGRTELPDTVTATVQIGNYFAGDRLTFTSGSTGIAVTDQGGGLYSLSGSSRANILQVLQSAEFSSTSDNPTNFGANLTRTVTFRVNDGQPTNNLSNTVVSTVNVTGVNDPPAGADRAVTTAEDSSYTLVATDFGFTDPDSTAMAGVRIVSLPAKGSLTLNGNPVAAGDFITTADITANRLRYTPVANENGSTYTTFTFSVRDNSSDAATEYDPTPNTITVNVTPVNDAPIATNSASLVAVAEDASNPTGFLVSTLLAGNYSDAIDTVPGGSTGTVLAGIAIVSNAATAVQGTWQYYNGSAWVGIPAAGLSTTTALVIPASTELRFLPAANFNGTPGSLTVHLSDGAGFSAGSSVNLTGAIGGTNGWSVNTVAIGTTVTAINDAPVATGTATLPSLSEDATNPTGSTVSSLFTGNFSDSTDQVIGGSTANTLAGVAIASNGTTPQGTWEYYNGTTWTAVGNRAPGNALVVSATDQLRFVPALNYNGPIPTLNVYLIDNSAGGVTTGDTVNLGGGAAVGGITPYSATTVPLNGSVTPVNDPPDGADKAITLNEDGSYTVTIADFGFTDPDTGDTLSAVRIDTLPAKGNLTLDGAVITPGQIISAADITAGLLVFTPVANENGNTYSSFTFSVRDSSGVIATEFDPAPNTLTFNVTPVNDAPIATGTASLGAIAEDTTNPTGTTVSSLFGGNFSDSTDQVVGGSTANTLAGVAIVGNAATSAEGTWQYYNGTTWVDVGTRSPNSALIIASSSELRFLPALNYNGSIPTLTVHLIDNSAGSVTTGTAIDLSGGAIGGTTPYSNTTVPLNGTVNPVNDPPTGTDKTITTLEDTGYVLTASDFGFADVDGHTFTNVRIDVLPGAGTLRLDGNAVAAGQVIAIADVNAGLLVFTPAADARGTNYANFTFSVQDSSNAFDTAPNTITIDVTPANDAPVFAALDASPRYIIGGSAVVLDADATVSDPELTAFNNWDGAVLTLQRQGGANAEDGFSGSGTLGGLTAGNSLTVGGVTVGAVTTNSGGTLTLTFNASATSVLVNSVLQQIAYSNTGSASTPVTIIYTLNDGNTGAQGSGGALTGSGTVTVDVLLKGDPPVVTAGGAFTYTENQPGLSIAPNLTLNDPDSTQLSSATVTISSGFTVGDLLEVNTQGTNLIASYDPNAGILSLTGADSLTNYQQVMRSLTYRSTSDDPTRTATTREVTWQVTDISSNGAPSENSTPVTTSIMVIPVNDPPTVDLDGNNSSGVTGNDYRAPYKPGQPVRIADVDPQITDLDDTNIEWAQIILTNPLNGNAESLSVVGSLPGGIIAGAYNPQTGQLRLSGSASLADYQTAIASIVYNNTARIPNPTDRTVTVVVNDGNASSPIATSTLMLDTDGDGIANSTDLDDDNDGILDQVEMRENPDRDTDGDGIIDRLDLDSDNDGINDLRESGLSQQMITALDQNNDGMIDSGNSFGGNGYADKVETGVDTGIATYITIDTDGDREFNFQDIDSDNDGSSDLFESGFGFPDADRDGRIDSPDGDGDGMVDLFDRTPGFGGGSTFTRMPDNNGNGSPDPYDIGRSVTGSVGPDRIIGTDGDDILNGFSDRDIIFGRGGNDIINGGSDPDALRGDEGNDILNGGTNNDDMDGGTGNDILNGGDGNDLMRGGFGDDILNGGNGNDRMFGGHGVDRLNGGNGDDLLQGDAGNDILVGDRGNDALIGGLGRDRLTGGQGNDRFVYRSIREFGDIITDFEIVRDRIDLSAIFRGRGSMQNIRLQQRGLDTIVQTVVGGQSYNLATVQRVNANTLAARHFQF